MEEGTPNPLLASLRVADYRLGNSQGSENLLLVRRTLTIRRGVRPHLMSPRESKGETEEVLSGVFNASLLVDEQVVRYIYGQVLVNQLEKSMKKNKVIIAVVLGMFAGISWSIVESARAIYELLQHSPMSLDDKIYVGADSVLCFFYMSFLFVQMDEFRNKRNYVSFKWMLIDSIMSCLPEMQSEEPATPRYDHHVIECPEWHTDG